MIVSGYTMDLYCDCPACIEARSRYQSDGSTHVHPIHGFTQMAGESFRECLSYAKRAGWKFKDNNTLCYAPGHKIPRTKP